MTDTTAVFDVGARTVPPLQDAAAAGAIDTMIDEAAPAHDPLAL
ncbi:hypothetical protein [Streptomyces mexicanus]|jgi:hypothetical protein|nr:hypothetical protein [Streptomyces mexicanus]